MERREEITRLERRSQERERERKKEREEEKRTEKEMEERGRKMEREGMRKRGGESERMRNVSFFEWRIKMKIQVLDFFRSRFKISPALCSFQLTFLASLFIPLSSSGLWRMKKRR